MDILRNVPLGIYLEAPFTWLHRLDPRVKLVWLLSVLLSPILATNLWRLSVVGVLILLTWIAGLPLRVWIRQLPLVLFFGIATFVLTALAPDGLGVTPLPQRQGPMAPAYGWVQVLSPENGSTDQIEHIEQTGAKRVISPEIPADLGEQLPPATDYRYELLSTRFLGVFPLRVTRRSLSLGLRVGTLIFTLLYSTNLFLVTTAPEEIAEGLERLLRPLRSLRIPTAEIILTLTLALRFLPLVLEEVQNLIRSVRTRDIRWQGLGFRGATHTFLMLVDRVLENLLLRAEQTAAAMQARGYGGPHHTVRWNLLHLTALDGVFLISLPGFWWIRMLYFSDL